MIIAINTRLLLKDRLEGIGWYMFENLKRITTANPEHIFLFIFDRPFDPEFIFSNNIKPIVVPPPTRHPLLWYAWFEYSLPRILRKHGAELYIGLDGFMPLKLKIPTLITIHDINFHHRPMDLRLSNRIYYRKYFPKFAHKADLITTVSEFSKSDLVNSYQIDPDKINVVYNGVNELYTPLPPEKVKEVRGSLTDGHPYFVFIGSMHPRKNLPNLLRGFDEFRTRIKQVFKLVIVGEKMFMAGDIDKTYKSLTNKDDIVFTGRLLPEELREVLGASAGLTFVPLFEGFGIPLLEAMRCEIPILTSDVTSLPEIAADAAIYTDPFQVKEISDGMYELATNRDLRKRLIKEGNERSNKFSWDRTSELLWKSVCSIIEQC